MASPAIPPPPSGTIIMPPSLGSIPPPPSGTIVHQQTSGASPQAAAPSTPPDPNSANPKGEGIYKMQSPDGRAVQIPYSKIETVGNQGYRFSDHGELARYARDHQADPVDEDRLDKFLNDHPWNPAAVTLSALKGVGTGVTKTLAGADRLVRGSGPLTRPEEQLQEAAETPAKGVVQNAGEGAENVGEYFTGEELLGLASKALPFAERLKQASTLAQTLDKSPTLAKLVRVGMSTVKQGTIAAGQTYTKTGGDTGAALTSGLETAGGGALIEGAAAPLARAAIGELAPQVAKGGEEFAQTAREAGRGPLEAVNAATSEARLASDLLPKIDVEQELGKYGDYTGVRAAMKDSLNKVVPAKVNAQFRTLTQQLEEAQTAAQGGGTAETAAYANKQKELEDLIDKAGLTPELRSAMKQGWKRYYALGDVTGAFDKALDGIPGESGVSQQQRGINGNRLLTGLKNQVVKYGRDTVSDALGGEEHLKALEAIGNATKTNASRQAFNRGWNEVTRYLPIYLGYHAGEAMGGGVVGRAVGSTAAVMGTAAARTQAERVLTAIRSNPKIAQNLIFAVDSGANPKNYGPLIATMIQQHETEASRQRQADADQQQQESDQQ